jgi:hypothetical protein
MIRDGGSKRRRSKSQAQAGLERAVCRVLVIYLRLWLPYAMAWSCRKSILKVGVELKNRYMISTEG